MPPLGGLSHPLQVQIDPHTVPQTHSTSCPSRVLACPPRDLGGFHMQLVVNSQAPGTLCTPRAIPHDLFVPNV